MIQELQVYPAYKSSGVDWLGDVPAHWEVTATKRHYAIQLGKMLQSVPKRPEDVEVPYLKALHVQWFDVLTSDVPTMWASHRETRQFGIKPGDLLVCEGGEGGRCAILNAQIDNCIIQNALHRVRPREQSLNVYLQYVMSTVAAIGWFDAINDKATIAHFTKEKFDALRIPLPPLPEQRAIARYLNHVDRRIQRYIEAKEQLIALLQEARQAIIQRAVTRGLDPDVPFEPSGVDWLGDVPAHWEVRRLGHLATKFGSGITPRGGATVYQEDGVPFLRSQNIHFDGLRIRNVARIAPSLHQELSSSHVTPGDVLLNITGASIGRACSVPDSFAEGNVNQHVCIIRPHPSRLLPGLLAAYLSAPMMQREIQIEQKGASREGLTLQSIRNFRVIVPPLSEQAAIASHLDRTTADIEAAIGTARRQVEFMTEYRASLIAHVVTGKLDVRAAAEQLPQEACELAVS